MSAVNFWRGDKKPHIERAMAIEGRGWICFGPGWEGTAIDETPAKAYRRFLQCRESSSMHWHGKPYGGAQ
jgi:hypothetical protein